MKMIFRIAATELKNLFYSPVAWVTTLVLTYVFFQRFSITMQGVVMVEQFGMSSPKQTFSLLNAAFESVKDSLFWYLPLLTMGVMANEYSRGSIKLYFSAPITNRQLVLGKFIGLAFYAAVLTGLMAIPCIYTSMIVINADIPWMLTVLLGFFLLFCTYCAVGLFFSSLTSYALVAAFCTIFAMGMLQYLGGVGQDIAFVRDITYWFVVSVRTNNFMEGLISTEDLIYFLIVVSMFLAFTVVKLKAAREHVRPAVNWLRFSAVLILAVSLGYLTTLPGMKYYYDATADKRNTITEKSQQVLAALKHEELTMTTYVNMLDYTSSLMYPTMVKTDIVRMQPYTRFMPALKMKYVFYYHKADFPFLDSKYPGFGDKERLDSVLNGMELDFEVLPYEAISHEVDLSGENYRLVKSIATKDGRQAFLRIFNDRRAYPSEAEITAAFKKLTLPKQPVVGFLTGHRERNYEDKHERSYRVVTSEKTYRGAMINHGIGFTKVFSDKPIPDSIDILLVADMIDPLTPDELKHIQQFVDRGGNMLIASEPDHQQVMNPLVAMLGLRLEPGTLVQPSEFHLPQHLFLPPTTAGKALSWHLASMDMEMFFQKILVMNSFPGVGAIQKQEDKGFHITSLFNTKDSSWIELETTNFIDDSVRLNPDAGEKMQSYSVAMALERKQNGRTQRIIVTGDADWMSNVELMTEHPNVKASNAGFTSAAFYWLTQDEMPIDMRRPVSPDISTRLLKMGGIAMIVAFQWVIPALILATGIFIWLRRKAR